MRFVVALTFTCMFSVEWLMVESAREATCLFGPERGEDVQENLRVMAGHPGKRGATGLQGLKGEPGVKGERGQTDESREELKAMRVKLETLENLMEEHLVEFQKLNEVSKKTKALLRNNCDDVAKEGLVDDGTYQIFLNGKVIDVYCELKSSGGNWMVFQKRFSGEVDFYLNWDAYQNGFGNMSGEFWLGLDNLHAITSSGSYKLRVDLEDWSGNTAYAEYSSFSVGDSSTNYRLNVGGFSGTAGDSLAWHNNQPFTTKDRDHDAYIGKCAVKYHGAWWYNSCHNSNLNGDYLIGSVSDEPRGIIWYHWKKAHHSLKKATMKLQRVP